MDRPPPSISIPDECWTDVDGDGNRLLASLVLNDCSLHVEAFAATRDGSVQTLPESARELAAISAEVGADGPWQTAIVRGREYVVVATPFGD